MKPALRFRDSRITKRVCDSSDDSTEAKMAIKEEAGEGLERLYNLRSVLRRLLTRSG